MYSLKSSSHDGGEAVAVPRSVVVVVAIHITHVSSMSCAGPS